MMDLTFPGLLEWLALFSLLFVTAAEGGALFHGLCYPATKDLRGVSKLKTGFAVYAMRSCWAHELIAILNKRSPQWNSRSAILAAVVTGVSTTFSENAGIQAVLQSSVVAFVLVFWSVGEAAKYMSFITTVSTDVLIHIMGKEHEETELI